MMIFIKLVKLFFGSDYGQVHCSLQSLAAKPCQDFTFDTLPDSSGGKKRVTSLSK
ncbi:hypothetical protein [Undibacterium sp. TC9W]|uniref:hypothetical protein n=1 Tax=Undibacterium sp. TC9W TaxID=3413053 RepID=UPI003BF5685A